MNRNHRIARTRTRRRGFSLIELTCALFVVTVGVFGALQLYTVGLTKMKTVDEYAVALRVLNNEVETLRALPFAELQPATKIPFRSHTPEGERLVNATGTVTITDRSEGGARLREVFVRLRWTGEYGRTIDKSLTTLIAEKR